MPNYYRSKANLVVAIILFLTINILLILSTKLDNLIVLTIINSILLIHFLLWLHVGKLKKSETTIRGYVNPLLFTIMLFFLVFLINHGFGNTCSGVIWTYSMLILGITPLTLITIYTIYALINDGSIDDSFFDRRGKTRGKILIRTCFASSVIIFLVIFSPVIINGFDYLIGDNEAEIRELVNDLIKDAENDTEKTLALLSWFDSGYKKKENISNIYNREIEKDNEILLQVGDDFVYIFSKPPHFCTRLDAENDMWVFCSRCGRCGEFGTLFNTMGHYTNLTVRKVDCPGEDHVWNEVLIDDNWIIVDPTGVNLPNSNGFDLPSNFIEEKVKNDLWNEGIMVEEGNVSYVYATYPESPDEKEDITYRYTVLTNITIKTVNINNQSIEGASIKVYSHNRLSMRYTKLERNTNETGEYTFTLGGGDYTFKAERGNLSGEKRGSFSENESNYNITIVLN